MSRVIRVAGRELVPIGTGYEPPAYVFAVGELTYRISPCADGVGYTLRCVTVDSETDAVFATLEEAVEHASRQEDRLSPFAWRGQSGFPCRISSS